MSQQDSSPLQQVIALINDLRQRADMLHANKGDLIPAFNEMLYEDERLSDLINGLSDEQFTQLQAMAVAQHIDRIGLIGDALPAIDSIRLTRVIDPDDLQYATNHYFDSSQDAYDLCMSGVSRIGERIQRDDILIIPAERVVGIAAVYPIAVTTESGELHGITTLFGDPTIPALTWRAAVGYAEQYGFELNPAVRLQIDKADKATRLQAVEADTVQSAIAHAVAAFEHQNPMTKIGCQLSGASPGAFRNMVASYIKDYYRPAYAQEVDVLGSLTDEQTAIAIKGYYERLAATVPAKYSYASLPPDAPVPELVLGDDTYAPHPGYHLATLVTHLPLPGEQRRSICAVTPDGVVIGYSGSKVSVAASESRHDGNDICYSVVDRHGNEYPVYAEGDAFKQPVVGNYDDFAFNHGMSKDQLAFVYESQVTKLLSRHFGLGQQDAYLDDDKVKRLVEAGVAPHAYVNRLAVDHAYVRQTGSDPLAPLTMDDERLARVQYYEYLATEDVGACDIFNEKNDPGIRIGDVVCAVEEQVIAISTMDGFKAITMETGIFNRLQEHEKEAINPYSLQVAREAAEYHQYPLSAPTKGMRM